MAYQFVWNTASGVAGGLIVAGVTGSIVLIRDRWLLKKGFFSGDWEQTIPAHKGEPAKRDLLHCEQKRHLVTATISRVEPRDEERRRWCFAGRHQGDLFGHFWAEDSYGTMFLRMKTRDHFSGFYWRLSRIKDPLDPVSLEREIPVEWKRLPSAKAGNN